ncbi:GyrI-like domain-containing protein [Negadavirga shengliensis]|uniref:GyrI-like domain-containing protein n=1 Tax=Negadavirga shengliensis TaxID=1389218 RepID=A0ABV9T7M6_9BACT
METQQKKGFVLIGIRHPGKTTNENGQSGIDCGNLWQKFEKEGYAARIPARVGDEVYAVYFDYEGDHTQPFAYFIGCKVRSGVDVPEGMAKLEVPAGDYTLVRAKGKMPDCMVNAWKEVWESDIPRAYGMDFEVYGEKSRDWSNAKVAIYLSVR